MIIFGQLSLFGYILKGLSLIDHMAGYRILSFFQSIFILFTAVSILDVAVEFGMNEAFFGTSTSAWWSTFAFWAYLFAVVAILQLVKCFIVTEGKN